MLLDPYSQEKINDLGLIGRLPPGMVYNPIRKYSIRFKTLDIPDDWYGAMEYVFYTDKPEPIDFLHKSFKGAWHCYFKLEDIQEIELVLIETKLSQ